jgi:hypothetical protein
MIRAGAWAALLTLSGLAAGPAATERALVADGSGLVEVASTGEAHVLTPGPISWCSVDARASVVWLVTAAGLQAYDLLDRKSHTVVAGDLSGLAVIVSWGDEQLGGEDEGAFDVALALRLRPSPALAVELGCSGDRAVYCYEEDGTTPTSEVAASRQRAARLRLADPGYVAALAARGARGSLWTRPPARRPRPARKPLVDRKLCQENDNCGRLIPIPASPLWLVVTANSRGDYYHESRELWDPGTGAFLRPRGQRLARSKRAPPDPTASVYYEGMRVSPTGTLSHQGVVFDATKVIYQPRPGPGLGQSCGWVEGGFRMAGPTE